MRRLLLALTLLLGCIHQPPGPAPAFGAIYAPQGPPATLTSFILRGSTFSGLPCGSVLSPINDCGYFWDEFIVTGAVGSAQPGWLLSATGSGTKSDPTGTSGGLIQLSSGATASSQSIMLSTGAAPIANVTTVRWYTACRFKIVTTPDAQSKALCGLQTQAGGATQGIGFIGPLNTTHFVFQWNGNLSTSSTDLGVNVDTNFHLFEMWGNGTSTTFESIDGGQVFSQTVASNITWTPFIAVLNGTTAAAQTVQADYFFAEGPRQTP